MMIAYQNIEMQQNANVKLFEPFLQRENFPIIMEIGTRSGAFTRYIKDISPKSDVFSYDVIDQKPDNLNKQNINFIIKNIFENDYEVVSDAEALSILNGPAKKLILCDNGNKIKEFRCLAKYMKIGDVIMCHDYSTSREYFDSHINGKLWNWCEVIESDISAASDEYGLVAYNQEEFLKAVWGCKIKVK